MEFIDLFFFFVASSGTATINADGTVQILVEEAAPLEDFDLQVIVRNLLGMKVVSIGGMGLSHFVFRNTVM